jgi:hypothetical protein
MMLAPVMIAAVSGWLRPIDSASPPIAVIVNRNNRVEDITMPELASVYLGRTSTFEHGPRVALCEHRDARARFYKSVLRMSETAVSRHWIGVVFSESNAKPPREFQEADSAQRFVATSRGGICFIELPAIMQPGVKVLTVGGLPPNDPSYPIQ